MVFEDKEDRPARQRGEGYVFLEVSPRTQCARDDLWAVFYTHLIRISDHHKRRRPEKRRISQPKGD